jgi:hypothetical protein
MRLAGIARQQKGGSLEDRIDAAILADPVRPKHIADNRRYTENRRMRRIAEERRAEEKRRAATNEAAERGRPGGQRAQRYADITGHAKMIVGPWYTDEHGCMSRYLVGAPLDAKGKVETIVSRCIEAREANRRTEFEAAEAKPYVHCAL